MNSQIAQLSTFFDLEWVTFLLQFGPFAPAIQNGSSFSLHTIQVKCSGSMPFKSQYFSHMTPHFFIYTVRVRAQENLFISFKWKLLKGFLLNVETALNAFYSNSPRDGVIMPFLSTYSSRVHFLCYIPLHSMELTTVCWNCNWEYITFSHVFYRKMLNFDSKLEVVRLFSSNTFCILLKTIPLTKASSSLNRKKRQKQCNERNFATRGHNTSQRNMKQFDFIIWYSISFEIIFRICMK